MKIKKYVHSAFRDRVSVRIREVVLGLNYTGLYRFNVFVTPKISKIYFHEYLVSQSLE